MKFLSRLARREGPSPQPVTQVPEPAISLRSVSRSHVGNVRALNEDRLVEMPEVGLWAVADGMGGHRAGDVAAQMVADALRSAAATTLGVEEAVAAAHRVNEELLQISRMTGGRDISGSTMVALIVREGRYQCLWAGDSRAYLFRAGACRRINRDHSLVQELVDAGLLAADAAASHPQAHVITRALGVAPDLKLDQSDGSVEPGDILLLCSDGLSDVLSKDRIETHLAAGSIEDKADALLDAALRAGAPDNVTFILIEALG